jgi:hypothetical protein
MNKRPPKRHPVNSMSVNNNASSSQPDDAVASQARTVPQLGHLGLVTALPKRQLGDPEHAGQRRAQFVRDQPQEALFAWSSTASCALDSANWRVRCLDQFFEPTVLFLQFLLQVLQTQVGA